MIKLGNNDITLKVGSTDVSAAYLGSTLVYISTPPEPKWIATYTGGTTSSAQCGSSSAITQNEINITDLVSVDIGDCVTSIGNSAFYGCSGLTSINIPDSVTGIGNNAFYDCSGLTSITIPDSVTSIGNRIFMNCSSLINATIGSGVTSISEYTFYRCRSLTSITIPGSVTVIGNNAFYGCSGLTSINIPDSVTSIGNSAFRDCTGLTSVTIGSGVTSISGSAFNNCTSLTGVTVNTTTPPTLNNTNIFNNTNNCPIYVPCKSVNTYKTASGWSTYADRITCIEPEPKWIATYTGGTTSSAECDASSAITTNEITKANLQSVEIHSCVTSIGNSVFSYCSGLTSVTIPDSVTSIGDYSFKYCSGLTSVNIPSGVTSIGTQAFYECTNAQITSLPNYITTIGSSAFSYCESMTTVNIPSGVTTINDWAFRGNYLTSVTIPSGVTSIGKQAFAMCTKLESVICYATTPPTLVTGAFNNNKSGRKFYVPAASVNAYKSASGWSSYASYIQAIP